MTRLQPHPLKILLGVDGSEYALVAARLIRDLPLPSGSEVTAVAVLTSNQTPDRDALSAALDATQTLLWEHDVEVHTGLLHGQPVEELTRFADEHRSDLVVVGAQGSHPTLGRRLGGVAQQVVEHTRGPVLVVRAPYTGLRRVLAATDGSPPSEHAVDYAARFPFPAGVKVTVMHVLPPMPELNLLIHDRPFTEEMIAPLTLDDVDRIHKQTAVEEQGTRAILAQAVEALKLSGIEAATLLTRGDAATEIIRYAQAHAFDLIAAGSRGHQAVTGWLLGSVVRKLVHSGECSVLIVKELAAGVATGYS